MQTPDSNTNIDQPSPPAMTKFLAVTIISTVVFAVIALALPVRFRLHGIFALAIGGVLGTVVGAFQPFKWRGKSLRLPGLAVAVFAIVAWTAVSGFIYRDYSRAVADEWKSSPAQAMLNMSAKTNGQPEMAADPALVTQLIQKTAAERAEKLAQKTSVAAWLIARLDKRLQVNSVMLAGGLWIAEAVLAGVAAFCGFLRAARMALLNDS